MAENKTMTNREFYNAVIKADGISEELKEFAEKALVALDNKNTNRKAKEGEKKAAEYAPIEKAIYDLLVEKGTVMTASAIGIELGISTQKVTPRAKALADEGKVAVSDVKEKGKSAVKGYKAIIAE